MRHATEISATRQQYRTPSVAGVGWWRHEQLISGGPAGKLPRGELLFISKAGAEQRRHYVVDKKLQANESRRNFIVYENLDICGENTQFS